MQDHIKSIKESLGNQVSEVEQFRENRIKLKTTKENLLDVLIFLKKELGFNSLSSIAGLDLEEEGLEVIYFLNRWDGDPTVLAIHVPLKDLTNLKLPSIIGLWGAADWHEREVYDLFGVVFEGHPNLKRILLPEEWDTWEHKHISELFPMRREYKLPEKPFSYKPGMPQALQRGKIGEREP